MLASRLVVRSFLFTLVIGAHATAQDLQWAQNPANAHWYGIPFPPSNWTSAEAIAVVQHGHLVTINNAAENTWISQSFVGFNASGYWIGFNDIATEGSFVWTSGESNGYTNWNTGEPNNGGGVEDVAGILPGSSWRWGDFSLSDSTRTALVEIDSIPQAGWTLPTQLTSQNAPGDLAVGDLNGDNRNDIVVPNTSSNSISIFLGQAGGAFGNATNVSTPQGPRAVVLARFNGDAHIDAAVSCDAQQVRVLFGDGTGAFPMTATINVPAPARGLVAADFNGDSLTDFAVTTVGTQDRLVIVLNLGGGNFSAPQVYPTGSRPLYVTAGDLDEDGDIDLVVANFDSNDLGLYFNRGDGTFTTGALLARGHQPSHVAITDVDGDGHVDLAIPDRLDGFLRLFWGNGNGVFGLGAAVPVGNEPTWVTTGDFDGDSRADLVVSNFASDSATVYYVRGLGVLDGPHEIRIGDGALSIVAADLDGDGRPDLAASANLAQRAIVVRHLSRDCNQNGVDDPRDIDLGTSVDCNANGVPDECDLALPASFDCNANGAIDSCEIANNATLDLDHDGTLDECENAGTTYCYGDGSGSACPCDPGQAGATGHGCANSASASARLDAVGNPSVALDSVSLRASGMLPSAVGLFFQGQIQQNGGLGTSLGDGLLCVNQSVIRLVIRTASGGAMSYGRDHLSDPHVSAAGQLPPAGGTRYYQVWYRDAAAFCTPSTFNLSNGVRIVWTP